VHVRDVETIDVRDMEAFEMREAEAIDAKAINVCSVESVDRVVYRVIVVRK